MKNIQHPSGCPEAPLLLLIGAGHSHLHVVKHAAELVAAGYRVQLLAPHFFDYSGLASASAAGAVARDTAQIDIRALAGACGVEFYEGTLAALDCEAGIAVASDGGCLSYDVLSINIGSVVAPAGMNIHPETMRVKPLSGLAELDSRLRNSAHPGAKVTVVGGGASGVELAAHLSVRSDVLSVQLVEAGPIVCADLPEGARRRLMQLLHQRKVALHTGCLVQEVGESALVHTDGPDIPHDIAVLAAGLTAPSVLAEIGLGDEDGVPVRSTLQHIERDEIYASGDCANFVPSPLPRIGVHGVRQGPILLASLLARLGDKPLPEYRPRRRALSILDLGDGKGLAVRGRWWWYGTSSLRLKRYIDRRWLNTYREG